MPTQSALNRLLKRVWVGRSSRHMPGPSRIVRRFLPSAPTTLEERIVLTSSELLAAQASLAGLSQVMDRDFSRFPVYDDVSSPGNHFHAWAKIGDNHDALKISGAWTTNPDSGATAIRFDLTRDSSGTNYGGFYFLNGILPNGAVAPQLNFGTVPNAGVDLSGATALVFRARGARGGEIVNFFMGGVGRDPVTGLPNAPHPDSTPVAKITVRLTSNWQTYTIPLGGRDLRYVLGGFGLDASTLTNGGDVAVLVDSIEYELSPTARDQRLNTPRLIRSYETLPVQPNPFDANTADDIDFVLRNTAFTYDNALAVLAYLADPTGNPDSLRRARLIGDALVYAAGHDRTFTDGRLRSAFAAGEASLPPGWTPNNRIGTAPIPGFYVEARDGSGLGTFHEVRDGFNKSDVGDNAWGMIALLALYRRTGKGAYLDAARSIGTFIRQFRNTAGLYPGFQGGLDNPESTAPTRRVWSSSEHNLDVAAAFTAMAQITGDPQWRQDAMLAASFVESMYDPARGGYLAGTTDPDHRNTAAFQYPLDVQAWRALAIPDFQGRVARAIASAEANHRTSSTGFNGYDFNNDKDGVWFEGTGQMSVAYAFARRPADAAFYRAELRRAQETTSPAGASTVASLIPATPNAQITTGFGFQYFDRLHVGATAWAGVFGQLGFNPYDQTYAQPVAVEPAVIRLSAPTYAVLEDQGVVVVSVVRGGELGSRVSVRLVTSDGTARGGTDYTPVNVVLTLEPKETIKRVLVPIAKNRRWDPVRQFQVVLNVASSQGAVQQGEPSRAVVTIVDDDPPARLRLPVQRILARGRLVGLDLSFDQPLDPTRARDTRNYLVHELKPNGQPGVRVNALVTYAAGSTTVKIRFTSPLPAGRQVRLTVVGQPTRGVSGISLDLIDGDGDGRPGGNVVTIV